MDDRPTFLSLFSGAGGLDLGLERAGWRCVGQVEQDPFCLAVLAEHWPDVPRWGDIRELDPAELPRCDLVAGGVPCQPVSQAGRRLAQADPRWLWPEFARILRVVRPRFALVENVPGLVTAGLADILCDLAALGFDAEWGVLSAADVGAPHLRERIFVIATLADTDGSERWTHAERRHDERHGDDAGGHQASGGSCVGGAAGEAVAHARRLGVQRGSRHGDDAGPQGAGEGEGTQRQRLRADAGARGEAVAHANGSRPQGHGRPVGSAGEWPAAPSDLAHPECPGWRPPWRPAAGEAPSWRTSTLASGSGGLGEPESRLGGVPSGLSARVHRSRVSDSTKEASR